MTERPPTPQRRLIYKGVKIDLALQRVVMADGTHQDREVVVHRGAVALVPMVDADHVCLLRNYRYSAN
jgi:ADP-ribose pyrophosphatase